MLKRWQVLQVDRHGRRREEGRETRRVKIVDTPIERLFPVAVMSRWLQASIRGLRPVSDSAMRPKQTIDEAAPLLGPSPDALGRLSFSAELDLLFRASVRRIGLARRS